MSPLSRGRQRRHGPRSASRDGPGREDSTTLPAEKVSFKSTIITQTLKHNYRNIYHGCISHPHCNTGLPVEQRCTDCDSLVPLMQCKEITSEGLAVMRAGTRGRWPHEFIRIAVWTVFSQRAVSLFPFSNMWRDACFGSVTPRSRQVSLILKCER